MVKRCLFGAVDRIVALFHNIIRGSPYWNYFTKAIYFQFLRKIISSPAKCSNVELTHLSHRCFHCSKHFQQLSSEMTDSCSLVFFLNSSMLSNRCHFMPSKRLRCVEQRIPFLAKNCSTGMGGQRSKLRINPFNSQSFR